MRNHLTAVITAVSISLPVIVSAQNSCDQLLQHGINNITREFSTEHTLVYKYFESCSVDHNLSTDSTVSAADGRIFGFGSGSANLNISQKRERVIQFCEENEDFAEANRSMYEASQTLSTEALTSWNQCIAMYRKDIRISMSPHGSMSQFVHFEIDSTHDGDLRFFGITENGYECNVEMVKDGQKVALQNDQPYIRNSNIQVDCTRQAPTTAEEDGKGRKTYDLAYISVNTSGPSLSVSFPEVVEDYYVTPPNSVLTFNAVECPAGWVPYKPAQGRFVRGIDPTASGTDPEGTRSLGSLQAADVGAHNHAYRGDRARGVTSADNGGDRQGLWHHGDWKQSKSRNTHANPGGETRPVNVALLFCEKR